MSTLFDFLMWKTAVSVILGGDFYSHDCYSHDCILTVFSPARVRARGLTLVYLAANSFYIKHNPLRHLTFRPFSRSVNKYSLVRIVFSIHKTRQLKKV